jgi:SHS2 domain-containing protein
LRDIRQNPQRAFCQWRYSSVRFDSGSKARPGKFSCFGRKYNLHGNGLEDLLINFLREVLYLFHGKKWVAIDCRPVEINRKRIVVQLHGEPYNLQKHPATMEIKAVTYHGLSVKKTVQGWTARVIFDV